MRESRFHCPVKRWAAYRVASTTVVIALLGTACGTTTIKPLARDDAAIVDMETHGILVGSAMFSGYYAGEGKVFPGNPIKSPFFRCQNYQMLIQSSDNREGRLVADLVAIPSTTVEKRSPTDPFDYEVEDGVGYLQAIALPAGQYEVWFAGYYCLTTGYYMNEFRIPFKVDPGGVYYFGEIGYLHRFDDVLMGVYAFVGAEIAIADQWDRDIPLLKSQYPLLGDAEFQWLDLDWTKLYVRVK